MNWLIVQSCNFSEQVLPFQNWKSETKHTS